MFAEENFDIGFRIPFIKSPGRVKPPRVKPHVHVNPPPINPAHVNPPAPPFTRDPELVHRLRPGPVNP